MSPERLVKGDLHSRNAGSGAMGTAPPFRVHTGVNEAVFKQPQPVALESLPNKQRVAMLIRQQK